ncbi:unnamed protein product [Protopolystoma xenopodis]|uniref:Uncharacterized protein n=1 Tax=Protopolystoma xenopodis TaxID=117903 RepID=A0A448WLR6_9PLAT|nr:unnamed protein product [Protopolystoma xenopodis]
MREAASTGPWPGHHDREPRSQERCDNHIGRPTVASYGDILSQRCAGSIPVVQSSGSIADRPLLPLLTLLNRAATEALGEDPSREKAKQTWCLRDSQSPTRQANAAGIHRQNSRSEG